jgi:hypothetical protein
LIAVNAHRLHTHLARTLVALRRPDGGFPTSLEGQSEVEPTAVASLALSDRAARRWLAGRQRADGGFAEPDGRADGPTSGALAALALGERDRARGALAHAIGLRGLPQPTEPDPEQRRGWGWTADARSLVEPTARVLLAVNALTPADAGTRAEAIRFLRDHQCADGGWNYGNASVYDVDLRGYAQTTAIALIALQGGPRSLVDPGLRFLRAGWAIEPGGLTAAQSLVAFRLHGVADQIEPARAALEGVVSRSWFRERPLAVAWAALATGPESLLEPLRSRA